jgi:3-oxoacyl-[acyl-carrier-protein] synthase II
LRGVILELKRAVITGLGAITPIGIGVESFWESLIAGVNGCELISRFDTTLFDTRIACEIKGFNPEDYFSLKDARKYDRFTQYSLVAARAAMTDAQLGKDSVDPWKGGVIWASGIGGLETLQQEIQNYSKLGRPRFNPGFIPKMITNIAAGHIAIEYDYRGICFSPVSACASSSHALIDALNYIRLGKADVIIAGGAEAPINETALGGFSSMKALSRRNDSPQTASRPFDKDRDGFVMGEGAGALIIEEREHAIARGAKIYAEFAGGAMTADAFHITLPHPEGRSVAQAMRSALDDAQINTSEVDYINLHGTSTPAGDLPELIAVQSVFCDSLDKLHVSATKSMTGHLLGGAGAIEAIASIMSIQKGMIPPTMNCQEVDPLIPVNINLTLNTAVKKQVDVAMSNTFGFGGQNAVVVFKKYS